MDMLTNNIIVFENFVISGATKFRSESYFFHLAKFDILYRNKKQTLKYAPDYQNIS